MNTLTEQSSLVEDIFFIKSVELINATVLTSSEHTGSWHVTQTTGKVCTECTGIPS